MENRNRERKYYTAYDERYKTAHALGVSWAGSQSTPIVSEILEKYCVTRNHRLLEIGCGEGRDARAVLAAGYPLLATDVSPEVVDYCRQICPKHAEHFKILDCLTQGLDQKFDFVYAVAVIHMLVPDEDRDGFYRFIREHLAEDGIALICSMGDGETEFQTDVSTAFIPQQRSHESGTMTVAGTSCRMVSLRTLERELHRNRLKILETGLTGALPEFDSLLYAVVGRE